jgi:hypothetical protein
MNWIIHFELIETIIQMLHIAFTSIYWNTYNNLMFHVYIWTNQWIFYIFWTINIYLWVESFILNVSNPLLISCILHNFLKWMYKKKAHLTFIFEWVSDYIKMFMNAN